MAGYREANRNSSKEIGLGKRDYKEINKNMHVLYLHQYFVTPEEYGATRSYWFCKKLIERGHQVTVISALSSSTKREKGKHNIEGIQVIYVGNRYSNLLPVYKKVYLFVEFFFKALWTAGRQKTVDIVYATSTPLTVGAFALLLKFWKKFHYVFEVRDLWPEFPIQIGAIRNPVLIRSLKWLERKIYKGAEHIVALSPGMKDGVINAGIEQKKVTVIPNMSKPDLFYPRPKSSEIAKSFGLSATNFFVIHFGSMGSANGLEYLVEAACLLNAMPDNNIHFIFAGYGGTENKLKKIVETRKINNVKFVGKHDTFIISELVNYCDISCVSFQNLPILQTNSPNKLFDSLSAGKPIIVNSFGWTKDLVEQNYCGVFVDPELPNDMVSKLVYLKNNQQVCKTMGENARKLSLESFDKEKLSKEYVELMELINRSN